MRRFFAFLLGLGFAAASPAAAQSVVAPLPSGVTLRIHGPGSSITGVLYQQSVDSVWLRRRGSDAAIRGIAVANIQRVEEAQPAYALSVLAGTGLGGLVGAALYSVTAKNDRDLTVGLSVITGAVMGLLFPHTNWVPVRLH
ncbi:MAG: hypothetical protein KGL93_08035 [Gemmatimonadota bacterium]|nr:hypothetical protein [Gemmatimonadota bacterium]